ncbi:MAG TPA: condensation domain-containing protein, partial [Pseudonocardia sp.]|nr:condensation domain-containing protein [Pseudonocardia sp.]
MADAHDHAHRNGGQQATTTAETLADLWRGLLHVPVRGHDADFFALGGDSFQAAQLAHLISERFGVRAAPDLAFDIPEIGGQARWIDEQRPRTVAPATGAPAAPPLSTQQEDFFVWMAEGAVPRDIGAITVAMRITDTFDVGLFREALSTVVRRHEALRTVCRADGGRYSAWIVDDLPPDVAVVEAQGANPTEREADARRLAEVERTRLSDVTTDPMVRALVIRLGPDDHVLVLSVHHFVFDGWSMGLVLRETGLVYSALRTGRSSPLKPLEMTYSEYCAWSRTQWPLNEPYWDRVLDGAPRALEPFPGRGVSDRFSWRMHPFEVGAAAATRLREAARTRGATAYMGVTTCWTALLAEWTGLSDLILMSPAPGR